MGREKEKKTKKELKTEFSKKKKELTLKGNWERKRERRGFWKEQRRSTVGDWGNESKNMEAASHSTPLKKLLFKQILKRMRMIRNA